MGETHGDRLTEAMFTAPLRKSFCVSCWQRNQHQSAAMWKLYLKSDEGVAVRTTFADVRRAFAETPDVIYPAVVQYLDYTTDSFPNTNFYTPLAHKRKSFEHESEVRLIWCYLSNEKLLIARGEGGDWAGKNRGGVPLPFDAPGRAVKVDMPVLVQQVYVSPTSPPWFAKLVEAVTKKYGLSCPVIKSDLYTDPVW